MTSRQLQHDDCIDRVESLLRQIDDQALSSIYDVDSAAGFKELCTAYQSLHFRQRQELILPVHNVQINLVSFAGTHTPWSWSNGSAASSINTFPIVAEPFSNGFETACKFRLNLSVRH